MEDLSSWLTIKEFADQIGKKPRTVERLITLHRVTVAKRPSEGQKPITVIHPEDVEKQKGTVLRPTVEQSAKVPTRQAASLSANPSFRQPDMRVLLKALSLLRVPVSQKVYLSVKEAADLLGFPQSEVKRLVQAGTIPSIRLTNGWLRIARVDLEQYKPPTRQIAGWRNGSLEESHA